MPELLNRTFFNFTITFVAILLASFTLALIVGLVESTSAEEQIEQKVPLRAHGID